MTVLSLMSLAACRQSSSNSSSGGGRPLKEVAEELVKVEASGQGSSKQGAKRAAAAELILHLRRDLDVLPCWPGDGCVGREGQCATVHVKVLGAMLWCGGFLVCCTSCCHTASHIGWCRVGRHEARV